MRAQSRADKAADSFINATYAKACSGIQINIMDISKVFAVGRRAIAANPQITPSELGDVLRGFVETIRHN